MDSPERILMLILEASQKKILYLPHAIKQMSRVDRMITPEEVRKIIEEGNLIEDYPEDVRGHSCLLQGFGIKERPIHLECSPKEDYLQL